MSPLNVLSLFAGIGGLDLGLERAGMAVVGQVEIDPLCRAVLARHWPEVPRHDDVRTCVEWWGSDPRSTVHVVAGGPPCQPASHAGRRLGAADPRWGWPWFLDVVRAVRPRYVIAENPRGLLTLEDGAAFGWILGELADLGFDADWSLLPACAVGAPHTRERVFLVAHAAGEFRPPRLAQPERGVETALRPARYVEHAWRRPGVWLEAARSADRVVDGLAGRMVAAGGNAVVPQVAEYVGRLIVNAARSEVAA